ncbi:hypothetical protein SUDANB121_03904 [Nocardiopsis dassonvillei]|uniref:hypothetical protein n=1 Tax=Nocardiopsis dassonvillei TaxID=2014 RepID=UPI003F5785B0
MSGMVLVLGTAAGTVLFFLAFASGRRVLAWGVGAGALAAGILGARLLAEVPLWALLPPVCLSALLWGWLHVASRYADADEEAARYYPEVAGSGDGAPDRAGSA